MSAADMLEKTRHRQQVRRQYRRILESVKCPSDDLATALLEFDAVTTIEDKIETLRWVCRQGAELVMGQYNDRVEFRRRCDEELAKLEAAKEELES